MLKNLTVEQIENRLTTLERMMSDPRNVKELPLLSGIHSKLLEELVRRDIAREDGNLVEYYCLCCKRVVERLEGDEDDLPKGNERCSHEWEKINKEMESQLAQEAKEGR